MTIKSLIRNFLFFQIVIFLIGCDGKELQENVKEGAFFGMSPTMSPELLQPNLLASSLIEYNGTFNPTGNLFFFTTNTPAKGIICYTSMDEAGVWNSPKIADFSGVYSEYDPLFSPDGSRLYFSSERPIPGGHNNQKTHIWYVEIKDNAWSEPIYVELGGSGNYYSSLTNDGSIYFNVWNNGDMFKATPSDSNYVVTKLPDELNSQNGEGDPFIAPDESYLIFRGYNNSLGNGDLYISFQLENGWTEPENLGRPINSEYHEMCPYVTVDGEYFIFSSSRMSQDYSSAPDEDLTNLRAKHGSYDNGELNIYYMSADFINNMRAKHVK